MDMRDLLDMLYGLVYAITRCCRMYAGHFIRKLQTLCKTQIGCVIFIVVVSIICFLYVGPSHNSSEPAARRWPSLTFQKNVSIRPDVPWTKEIEQFSCEKLFANDNTEQRAVQSFVERLKKEMTSVTQWCYRDWYLGQIPCSEVLSAFNRPFNFTNDELDFPLAYGIRVHTCATQVELLLQAIYAPHNVYCLHVDGRSPPQFVAAMRRLAECTPNVLLAPIDYNFVYASASQMEADLECMRMVTKSSVEWRYFINLAGQELPLKTNRELVRLLRTFNGSSHVYFEPPIHARYANSIWCKNLQTNLTVECDNPQRKQPPPDGVKVNKSYANAEFSRPFVEYILDPGSFAQLLYNWLYDTYAPEEHFYATLLALPGTPGGVWSMTRTRAMIWSGEGKCAGPMVRDICIIASGDLPWLVERPEPFVNKLHYEDDPVAVKCVVKRVIEREMRQHTQSASRESSVETA